MDRRAIVLKLGVLVGMLASAWAIERHWNRQRAEVHAEVGWPRVGQWHEVPRAKPSEEDTARLLALGYVEGTTEAPHLTGVTKYDARRAQPGLNFYVSGHASEAYLVDMSGKLLHTWSYLREKAFPNLQGFTAARDMDRLYWRMAKPRPDGSIIAIYEGAGLVALDWESRPIWTFQGWNHHDIDIAPDGTIYALGRKRRTVLEQQPHPFIDDLLQVLDADGKLVKELSIYDAIQNSDESDILRTVPPGEDILHTNAVRILDGSQTEKWPLFTKGRALLSIREIDALVVIDVESAKAVWSMMGTWHRQHAPEILASGNMLLFDNRGIENRSRVVEFSPTWQPLWTYDGNGTPFYSETCGGQQRLSNGNTLIAETEPGRALEVTPQGDIVWEFYNPHRTGKNDHLIAALFQMTRLPVDYAAAATVR